MQDSGTKLKLHQQTGTLLRNLYNWTIDKLTSFTTALFITNFPAIVTYK